LLKFSAVYKNRFESKEVLNDILRFEGNAPQAELMLRINFEKLQDGDFVVEGYKTIKTEDEEQNTAYFRLVKKDYKQLSSSAQKKMIVESFTAALETSIQDYVIVNRAALYQSGRKLRLMKKIAPEKYMASIYAVTQKGKWDRLQQKQKMYITPILEEDIHTLYNTGYISFDDTTLTTKQIEELVTALDRSFFDPVLVASYPNTVANMSDSDIVYKRDTVIVNVEDQYDLEDILMASYIDTQKAGFKEVYRNQNFIAEDLENEYGFSVLDYMQTYDNPSQAQLNRVYVEFKDQKVYKITTQTPDVVALVQEKDIDTLLWENGEFKYLYPKKDDMQMGFLFFPVGENLCGSDMFGPSIQQNILFVPLMWGFTYGLLAGSYVCEYKPDLQQHLIEQSGYRDLSLFRSEL